jgi:ABC-type multidrug transport system permease subunit
MYLPSDQDGQNANAILIGGVAAVIAYLLFGLLGFSARIRRLEAPLARAGATFGKRLGATRRAKARSLLLVAVGAIAGGLITVAVVLAVEVALTSIGLGDWTIYDAPSWALVGWLVLPAVLSMGIVAFFAFILRRVRISAGVGPFLVGYGGLFAVGWVLAIVSFGASCVTNPAFSNTGDVMPAACVVNTFVNGFSEGSGAFALAVLTLFCAIPAVGALLVYRDHRRRRAASSEPRLTHAVA